MRIKMTELEITYLSNMLEQIKADMKPIRDTYETVAALRNQINPKGWGKFTPGDCATVYDLLERAQQASQSVLSKLPVEGELDKKEHIAKVQSVVLSIQQKLAKAVS